MNANARNGTRKRITRPFRTETSLTMEGASLELYSTRRSVSPNESNVSLFVSKFLDNWHDLLRKNANHLISYLKVPCLNHPAGITTKESIKRCFQWFMDLISLLFAYFALNWLLLFNSSGMVSKSICDRLWLSLTLLNTKRKILKAHLWFFVLELSQVNLVIWKTTWPAALD